MDMNTRYLHTGKTCGQMEGVGKVGEPDPVSFEMMAGLFWIYLAFAGCALAFALVSRCMNKQSSPPYNCNRGGNINVNGSAADDGDDDDDAMLFLEDLGSKTNATAVLQSRLRQPGKHKMSETELLKHIASVLNTLMDFHA